MNQVIFLVIAGSIVFYLYIIPLLKKGNSVKTVQDLLEKDVEVTPEGRIRQKNTFRYVIEVWPVNNDTNSNQEKAMVWVNFRNMMNTLGFPYTMLIQSQYLDLKDYAAYYRDQAQSNPYLTPRMVECAEGVADQCMSIEEEKKTRDYSCYIMLHIDPLAESIDAGVQTGNAVFDDLLSKFNKDKKVNDEELIDLAAQMLDEARNEIFGHCEQIGMMYRQLDKAGVYSMNFKTLQKEMTLWSKLDDAVSNQSFTSDLDSITKRALEMEFGQEGKLNG
ncbi:hypothetical protein LJR153_007319 [Paenibacillus sp. LjRoot153]|uniref:hypothetical protein n=1 Tax=Paenibacillus sp. LjRoot153 TaxID=3342270 RepID=UPI003ECF3417